MLTCSRQSWWIGGEGQSLSVYPSRPDDIRGCRCCNPEQESQDRGRSFICKAKLSKVPTLMVSVLHRLQSYRDSGLIDLLANNLKPKRLSVDQSPSKPSNHISVSHRFHVRGSSSLNFEATEKIFTWKFISRMSPIHSASQIWSTRMRARARARFMFFALPVITWSIFGLFELFLSLTR